MNHLHNIHHQNERTTEHVRIDSSSIVVECKVKVKGVFVCGGVRSRRNVRHSFLLSLSRSSFSFLFDRDKHKSDIKRARTTVFEENNSHRSIQHGITSESETTKKTSTTRDVEYLRDVRSIANSRI